MHVCVCEHMYTCANGKRCVYMCVHTLLHNVVHVGSGYVPHHYMYVYGHSGLMRSSPKSGSIFGEKLSRRKSGDVVRCLVEREVR